MGADVIFIVERLTVRAWFTEILPALRKRHLHAVPTVVYVIDSSRLAFALARKTAWLVKATVDHLVFRLGDIQDESGVFMRLRLAIEDFRRIQQDILQSATARQALDHPDARGRLRMFLGKRITYFDISGYSFIWRALLVIQVVAWFRRTAWHGSRCVLFLETRPWMKELTAYGSDWAIEIIPVRSCRRDFRSLALRVFGDRMSLFKGRFWFFQDRLRAVLFSFRPWHASSVEPKEVRRVPSRARLGVEFSGQLNLADREQYSDLFFWQESSLSARDITLTFSLPHTPLDAPKQEELQRHGISSAVLNPRATTLLDAPLYFHTSRSRVFKPVLPPSSVYDSSTSGRWLRQQADFYASERYAWSDFFLRTDIRLYVLWQKFSAMHVVIADALQSIGGIVALYQRAIEIFPSPESAAATDVMFGYSKLHVDMERQSGSVIPYHVTVGYLGDFRFLLLQNKARELRAKLLTADARYIICFLDENSADDARWYAGHDFMRESYSFLLERVLKEPWLGLLLKPKTPSTLRRRLGPVAALLDQAVATGRCLLLGGGELHVHGTTPVALPALASDVVIQEHFGGSAAIEAALAGARVLLFDREGYPPTVLAQLKKGEVIFTSREDIWKAVCEDYAGKGKLPGFGDWTAVLPLLDPFRDGRAAERMGTYLHWLLSGLQQGRSRDSVLAQAAERYQGQWGKGLVTRIP